jgi:PEGA domain
MKHVFATSAVVLALTGCASIFNGQTQAVTIRSAPEGAAVAVTNRAGEKIHTGTTPVTLTLKRGAGYFKSETYSVVLTKEGFADRELTIYASLSGWYIGNILFGGLIGMLAVDPVTGAMYTFPDSVSGTLDAQAPKTSSLADTLTIVSTDSLTPAQMKRARPLTGTN